MFFIGKALWGPEKITEIPLNFSINQVLRYFNSLITPQTRVSVLNEVLTATKMLLANKDIPKYFEWKTVLDMLEGTFVHCDKMMEKKTRVDIVAEIYELMKTPLTLGDFPEFLLGQVFNLYLKFKNKKTFLDKHLTQLMINYMLNHEFAENFIAIMESCLLKEKQVEIRTLFLDILMDFYSENEDYETCFLLESIFLNNLEQFFLTRVEGSFST